VSIKIYGPSISTYVRSVRILLEEKGTPYEVVEIDILKNQHKEPAHLARQPFGRVPAVEHDGFMLYETDAVLRYLDEVVPGPSFQPADARQRARMNQVMGIIDSHGYDAMITRIVIPRIVAPMLGGQTDLAMVEGAVPTAEICLRELARIMSGDAYLAGTAPSLADVLLIPVCAYFSNTPEARLVEPHANLKAWWARVSARPSVQRTAPKL
jgi:glutathione S-transferase